MSRPTDNSEEEEEQDSNKFNAVNDHHYQEEQHDERSPLLPTTASSRPTSTTTNRDAKSEVIGLTLMALCALAFSSMTLFVKLSGASFPSFEIVLFRSVVQTALGLAGCAYIGINPFGNRRIRPWLVFRGVIGGLALAVNFYSVTHLPLADATVIMYLNPAFTAILAALVLGEPFRWFEGICVTLCLTGAVFVSKPEFLFGNGSASDHGQGNEERTLAVLAAVTGAILTAVAYCTIRKVGKAAHFLVHTFYFGVVASLMSIPALRTVQSPVLPEGWRQYAMLLMTGISAFIGQCLLSKGLQMAPAGPASVMRMNEIVLAFLFGICIFSEYPDWMSVLGATIIISTTTALGSRKWRNANNNPPRGNSR
ncbi:hypothetical protein BDB00DRAFT_845766 [Zychaea mexicana]|uniref:uncharacterized protein n=1 Tax=Zychaea mexicana TaxID=64656 RepID=UPI0022FF2C48|nr:uncharacterized protein BDB00DRAFT_845766 [Zychaea mexicana]KAI9488932.1 hypothetical protein BDB00DRAFT_845766 [Zychaea mexicana]